MKKNLIILLFFITISIEKTSVCGFKYTLNNIYNSFAALTAPQNALTLPMVFEATPGLLAFFDRKTIGDIFTNIAGSKGFISEQEIPVFNLALLCTPQGLIATIVIVITAAEVTYLVVKTAEGTYKIVRCITKDLYSALRCVSIDLYKIAKQGTKLIMHLCKKTPVLSKKEESLKEEIIAPA